MLTISDLTYRIGGRTLLSEASAQIPAGHKVGVVGRNGTGKTTLFKLLTGELEPNLGHISVPQGARIGYVRQDLPADDTPLIDVVLSSDTERAELLHRAEVEADALELAEVYERLTAIEAYEAPARAAQILAGLGFDHEAQQRPINSFSGGWRMRVALAAALFQRPDLLLLDEPTNHLDFEAIIWLEGFLQTYPHTVLLISHDRDILNRTVEHILHLDQQRLTLYAGNYDQFEVTRAAKRANQQALYEKQMALRAHMVAFVDRFRAKASKAKQAQSRLKALERMDMVEAIIAERSTAFAFPSPDALPPPLLTLDQVQVGYVPGQPVLRGVDFTLTAEDRIALLGANGNGKSTFIKLLAGALTPEAGDMMRHRKLRVGYFAQHQAEDLDLTATPYETLQRLLPRFDETRLRARLAQFGFDEDKVETPAGDLSGGEKARLMFAIMTYNSPHILLLDEPTNHLDIDTRQALISALNDFEGAVILVSHDPHLLDAVSDQLMVVSRGAVRPYDGDLESYKAQVLRERQAERSQDRATSKPKIQKSKKGPRARLENTIKKLEREMESLETSKHKHERTLADPDLATDADALAKYGAAYEEIISKLEALEHEWLEAQSQWEALDENL